MLKTPPIILSQKKQKVELIVNSIATPKKDINKKLVEMNLQEIKS